ncbi:TPA: hypothetical protein ACH3X2_002218 [Trebouxia sp. C0005]
MSNQDGEYGGGMTLHDRVARRGPSHQTSHKGHDGQYAQGTSHSLLRKPLFGSAVPRRQRTASVKRPSTSWHDAARQLRQRQAAVRRPFLATPLFPTFLRHPLTMLDLLHRLSITTPAASSIDLRPRLW